MQRIMPCLWFDGRAEEAMEFYTSVFKDSKVGKVTHYGEAGPGKPGSVMTVAFEIEGMEFMGLNGGPQYQFTPAVSFVIHCKNQKKVDYYWDRLLEGGTAVQCGWITDKFGVSWQIVPDILPRLLKEKDPERSQRVMQAMLQMVKLDIKALKAAARDDGGKSPRAGKPEKAERKAAKAEKAEKKAARKAERKAAKKAGKSAKADKG
jgi:predicted 3-demethylubiquinone-9 3-methyltransferase (glyoxalase superfamily)